MQYLVSEKSHNKDSEYSRPVGRDRNIGPATIQQYQIDRSCWCESSL